MSKQANLFHQMAVQVSNGRSTACRTGISVTELGVAAIQARSWGAGRSALDREN